MLKKTHSFVLIEEFQKRGVLFPSPVLSEQETDEYHIDFTLEIDERQAVAVELKTGELSVYQQNIFHGSIGNHSDVKRIGFSIRHIHPKFLRNRDVIYARGNKSYSGIRNLQRPIKFSETYNKTAYRTYLENKIF